MNKNRRQFLKDSSLVMASTMIASLLSTKHVCAAPLNDLPSYCSLQAGLSVNGIEMLETSGNVDLDNSVNLELNHLTDSFNVLPGFGFFDEGDSRDANAFASPKTVIANTNGTVVFGKYLLSMELGRHEWGGLAVAGIMAHEFAHIYQYQSEFFQLLTESQPTHKLLELHADYLAGYYIGLKRLRDNSSDIKAFLDSVYLKGDTNFNSRQHHGTPMEREQAMLAGYKVGLTNNTNIHKVADTGMIFVTNI